MIGPVYPIGGDSVRPSDIVPAAPSDPTATAASRTSRTLEPSGSGSALGNSQAIAEVFSAVADMLEEIGGGLENDKVMQALIALLILMTLLQGAEDSNGSSQISLGKSGISDGSDPLLIASSYTRTTILIEQTSVTNSYQMPAESAAAFDLGPLDSSGKSIDTFG